MNLFRSSQRAGGSPLSRRRFLHLAGVAAAGATLAARGSTPSAQPAQRKGQGVKAQLVYQDWRTDWFPPMARQMLDQFHATHPNIQIFYTIDPPSENFEEKMLADFQAGTMADVFAGQAPVEKMKAVSRQIEDAQRGYKVGGVCLGCQT